MLILCPVLHFNTGKLINRWSDCFYNANDWFLRKFLCGFFFWLKQWAKAGQWLECFVLMTSWHKLFCHYYSFLIDNEINCHALKCKYRTTANIIATSFLPLIKKLGKKMFKLQLGGRDFARNPNLLFPCRRVCVCWSLQQVGIILWKWILNCLSTNSYWWYPPLTP